MLDRLRGRLGDAILKLGAGASRIIPSPTAWTVIGLAFSLLSGYAFSRSTLFWQTLAGALLLVSGFIDVLDGAVARASNRTSKRGSFLDSTLDRLGEVAVFFGIILGGYPQPAIVLLAVAFSLLVSYTRAKADSLGVSLAGVGVGERSERLIVLAASSLLGALYYGVVIVLILALVTLVERIYRVAVALR